MGGAVACCGKNEADPNNINTTGFHKGSYNNLNIGLIVRMQAAMRGFLARKRV